MKTGVCADTLVECLRIGRSVELSEGFPRAFGPYALLSAFAHGGMGEVFLAKSGGIAGIDRLCVLKKLRHDLVQNEEYVNRFLDEARLVVQLNHANIAHVFDVGKVGTEYYLAMEYVSGVSMKGLLNRVVDDKRQIPVDVAIAMMAEALEGLDYAHRLEHPATHNVMVSYEGEVKLIDFGLALSELKEEQTESQVVMGKVAYMAPEQARGDRVNAACDQFAAGIVLYELLLGERFYGEMNNYQIWQVVGRGGFTPSKWAEIDEELVPILGRALHPDADSRWPTCGDFRDALMAWLVPRFPATSRRRVRTEIRSFFDGDTEKERSFLARFADVDPTDLRSDSASGSLSTGPVTNNVHLVQPGPDATMTATPHGGMLSVPPGTAATRREARRGDTDSTATHMLAAGLPVPAPASPRRTKRLILAASVVVALGVGVGFAVVRGGDRPQRRRARPVVEVAPPPTAPLADASLITPAPADAPRVAEALPTPADAPADLLTGEAGEARAKAGAEESPEAATTIEPPAASPPPVEKTEKVEKTEQAAKAKRKKHAKRKTSKATEKTGSEASDPLGPMTSAERKRAIRILKNCEDPGAPSILLVMRDKTVTIEDAGRELAEDVLMRCR